MMRADTKLADRITFKEWLREVANLHKGAETYVFSDRLISSVSVVSVQLFKCVPRCHYSECVNERRKDMSGGCPAKRLD